MIQAKSPVHVLLVDDLPENLLALEALLARDDVICLKARSGDEALELMLQHDIALALLDVQMPGMDGFELAEFMRGAERSRHIPIIFVTAGTADRQRRFRGYEAGAVDFIQKPIEADVLRSKAAVFIDLYRQRRLILSQRDELEAQAAALRAADDNKNAFLATLGHELRNPLMALNAGLHLLKRGASEERARIVHEKLDRQLAQLARLVDDLLDIARIDRGKIEICKERVRLASVISFAIELSEPQLHQGQHTLTTELAQCPEWIEVDAARIAQVISNLLNNAARYTPTGGKITLTARQAGQFAEIEVTDNGIGIPADMHTRIFEAFAQVAHPKARASQGLGVGLALARQLVTLHSGEIVLKSSAPGQGSVFLLRLPLAATTTEPEGRPD